MAACLVAAFLFTLVAGPLLEIGAMLRGESQVLRSLPAGETVSAIAEIERRFDERSLFVRWIRPRLQALLHRGFRYGNERVTEGFGGWLFLREDLDHLTRRDEAGRRAPDARDTPALDAIVDFQSQLAARGIRLLVVPVPTKLAIHPERFAGGAPAPLRVPREEALLGALRARRIETVELVTLHLERARLDGAAFLRSDSHWTPAAMDDAAREIAMRVREAVDLPAGRREEFQTEHWVRSGRGDLDALLDLKGGINQVVATLRTRRIEDPGRAVEGPRVLLLGDSFSGVYSLPELGWGGDAGLAERLSYHLGLPVDRILQNAGGASETRALFAGEWSREPSRFAALRVVVWQFAAREITSGTWRRTPLPPLERDGEPNAG